MIVFIVLLNIVILPKMKLDKAMKLLKKENYEDVYALLWEIGNYDAIASSKSDRAMKLLEKENYEDAYKLLREIGDKETIASSEYDRAMKLIDEKKYVSAFTLLNGLDYKDSEKKLEEIKVPYEKEAISKADVGASITFGAYEPEGYVSSGKETIEWIVLEKTNNKALIISKYALDEQPYNTEFAGVTWETCSLRRWLNDTFLKNAFNEEEQASIETVTVTADKNPEYATNPGNNTMDKVFLLSIAEAEKYFTTGGRKCVTATSKVECLWWLRSPGWDQAYAVVVNDIGGIETAGADVNCDAFSVRPALWINLEP